MNDELDRISDMARRIPSQKDASRDYGPGFNIFMVILALIATAIGIYVTVKNGRGEPPW